MRAQSKLEIGKMSVITVQRLRTTNIVKIKDLG